MILTTVNKILHAIVFDYSRLRFGHLTLYNKYASVGCFSSKQVARYAIAIDHNLLLMYIFILSISILVLIECFK